MDETPVLDIKPYIPYSDNPALHSQQTESQDDGDEHVISATASSNNSSDIASSEASETKIAPWLASSAVGNLTVRFTPTAEADTERFSKDSKEEEYRLEHYKDGKTVRAAIVEILQNDPRSVYRRNKCTDRLYYFNVDKVHVTCWFDNNHNIAEVLCCKPIS